MTEVIELRPQPGPQEMFLSTPADIAVYGGAAGGGKSFGILLEGARHTPNKDFGGVIFRRTSPMITNEGGLWDESNKIYPLLQAKAERHRSQLDLSIRIRRFVLSPAARKERPRLARIAALLSRL
jgi:hypothetical protein